MRARTPVSESAATIAESATAVAEATPEVPAETVEAVTMTAETITAAQTPVAIAVVEATAEAVAETPIAIETTTPGIKQTIEWKLKNFVEEFVAFSEGNLEALVESSRIWSAGMQELTKQIAAAGKTSFDEGVLTCKALSAVKPLKEAIDLQTSFSKTAIEKMIGDAELIAEDSIRLTAQTLAPITARVSLAVETFNKTP